MTLEFLVGIAIGYMSAPILSSLPNTNSALHRPNAVDGFAHLGVYLSHHQVEVTDRASLQGFAMGLLMGTILYPSISETKRHRYIVWGCRIVALPLIVMAFVLTIRNFCMSLASCGIPCCFVTIIDTVNPVSG